MSGGGLSLLADLAQAVSCCSGQEGVKSFSAVSMD
jgi:hypothetical protein